MEPNETKLESQNFRVYLCLKISNFFSHTWLDMHNCLLSLITFKNNKNNRGSGRNKYCKIDLFQSFIIPFNLLFQHCFSLSVFFHFLNQLCIPKNLKEKKCSVLEKFMDACMLLQQREGYLHGCKFCWLLLLNFSGSFLTTGESQTYTKIAMMHLCTVIVSQ